MKNQVSWLLKLLEQGILRRAQSKGAAFLEFSILAGLVAIVAVASVTSTGKEVVRLFCDATLAMVGKEASCGDPKVAEAPSDIIEIPEVYRPKTPNFVLAYTGASAAFSLDATEGTIEWGDGTSEPIKPGKVTYTHGYADEKRHLVNITGTVKGFKNTDFDTLTEVVSFGSVGLETLQDAFANTTNLRKVAALPDTVTSLNSAFLNSSSNPEGLETWNTSKVHSFYRIFRNTPNFNRNIAFWHTGSVSSFEEAFYDADAFTAEIGNWDMSSAVYIARMFRGADLFNASLSNWDVSRISDFDEVFMDAASFDKDVSKWNVSMAGRYLSGGAVKTYSNPHSYMERMFSGAAAFSHDLSSWCLDHFTAPAPAFSVNSSMASEPIWGYCGKPEAPEDAMALVYEGESAAFDISSNSKGFIDWGDGSSEAYFGNGYAARFSHEYETPGSYTVKIAGSPRTFANQAQQQLAEVQKFPSSLQSLNRAFVNADNLRKVPSDLPASVVGLGSAFEDNDGNPIGVSDWDVKNVSDFSKMFKNATTFSQDLSNWQTPAATNMQEMFLNAIAFESDLSKWDVRKVGMYYANSNAGWQPTSSPATSFAQMFANAAAFSSDLSSWCVSQVTSVPADFAAGTKDVRDPAWGFCGAPSSDTPDMQLVYDGGIASFDLAQPLRGYIDWGDGSYQTIPAGSSYFRNFSHEYAVPGEYVVSLFGSPTALQNKAAAELVEVRKFAESLSSLYDAFVNADNLRRVPATLPTKTTSLGGAFKEIDGNPAGISSWDVSRVVNFARMFMNSDFSQEIGHWQTGAATDMREMFSGATEFNSDLSKWQVSYVGKEWNSWHRRWDIYTDPHRYFERMFHNASSFSGDVSSWCVNHITAEPDSFSVGSNGARNPAWGFCGAPTSENASMEIVYDGASASFDVAQSGAGYIDWGDGSYETIPAGSSYYRNFKHTYDTPGEYVVSLSGAPTAFKNAAAAELVEVRKFAESLSSLNDAFVNADNLRSVPATLPTKTTSLAGAFQDVDGNPTGISSWDVSKVVSFARMFKDSGFAQQIGHWQTDAATDMREMFSGAAAFDSDLSKWQVYYVGRNWNSWHKRWDISTDPHRYFEKMFLNASSFSGDVSSWCVSHITTEPDSFSVGSNGARNPAWGFCGAPSSENASMELIYDGSVASFDLTQYSTGYIDWGDDTYQSFAYGNSYSQNFRHDYAVPGEYVVRTFGSPTAFRNKAAAELVEVVKFAPSLTSLSDAFVDADNLRRVPSALPANLSNMSQIFKDADSNPAGISDWDVSSVRYFGHAFWNAKAFAQDIAHWNTSNATDMRGMFRGATAFASDVSGWDVRKVGMSYNSSYRRWEPYSGAERYFEQMFEGATSASMDLKPWCVSQFSAIPASFSTGSAISHDPIWGFCDAQEPSATAMTMIYEGDNASFSAFMWKNGYVHWGDGTVEPTLSTTSSTRVLSHSYAEPGTYTVSISGTLYSYKNTALNELAEVVQFAPTMNSLASAFIDSDNLRRLPNDLPPSIGGLAYTFQNSDGALAGIENWNVGNVTDFRGIFQDATAMNLDLSNWDVSKAGRYKSGNNWITRSDAIYYMSSMFAGATSMAQDLSKWCVSHIASEPTMFLSGSAIVAPPVWGTCPAP